jgi:hypothetical protein
MVYNYFVRSKHLTQFRGEKKQTLKRVKFAESSFKEKGEFLMRGILRVYLPQKVVKPWDIK